MKRHLHRKVRIQVCDRVHSTTEIVTRGEVYAIPLGSSGKVEQISGIAVAVRFDTFPGGNHPGMGLGDICAWVTRGQLRLVTPAIRMVDGHPVWARDVAKGETIAVAPEQLAAAARR